MNKRSAYINTGLSIISGLLIAGLIYLQVNNEVLMANETIALVLFAAGLIFKRYNVVKPQYFLLICFIIVLLQVINFSYTVTSGDTSTTYHESRFTGFGLNPIVLIILSAYLAVNRKVFGKAIGNLFQGSDKELQDSFEKNISFYYDKFNKESTDELKIIFTSYKDYPKEAQIALLKIQQEREINFIEVV